MRLLKRLTTFALRLIAYITGATLVLAVVAVLIAGFTGVGGGFLAGQIASLLSTPDRRISIDGAGRLLGGKLRIESMSLADSQGIYAEIRDLAMDWSPLDLLDGRLTAERIAAGSVRIHRAPAVTEDKADEDSSGSGFSLPVEIDVRSLDLPVVDLGRGLAGRDIRLSLSGSGQAVSERIAAQLRARRADAQDAQATADLVYAPAENRLRLTGELGEPAGGLIAGLLRLPGAPALRLGVDGDGPLSDWKGKVTATVDGRPTLAIDATHSIDAGLRSITATGGGRFDALLPPQLRPLFEGETTIDLAASLDRNGAVIIDRGKLSTAALDLTASGRYAANGTNDLEARLVGTAGPVPFSWTSGEQTISATIEQLALSVNGPANGATINLKSRFASLKLPQGTLGGVDLAATSDSFDLATRTGPLQATVSVVESQLADAELDRILKAPLTIRAPLLLGENRLGFDGTTIESTTIGGKLSGDYALNEKTLTSRFELFAVPGILPATIAGKLNGTIGLAGTLDYALPRQLALSDLRLTSNLGEATGSVTLDAESRLTADLAGRISDLATLVDNISGGA
ncbi:MAG: translocation/assembly module TamB, partial [Rhizobium sp.]|nr:translocation/assembly module TamB [Rhizobium sp.]